MNVLSWFMYLLPDGLLTWVFYALFFAGVGLILASWFITIIPVVNKYRFPTQVIGILVFGLGCYLLGGLGVEQMWRERVKELQEKLHIAEQKSAQVNTEIKEKIVYRNRVIRDTQIVIQERIKEVEKRIDAQCKITDDTVNILNQAAVDPSKKGNK
jgi:type VI protein secretion system component VasK